NRPGHSVAQVIPRAPLIPTQGAQRPGERRVPSYAVLAALLVLASGMGYMLLGPRLGLPGVLGVGGLPTAKTSTLPTATMQQPTAPLATAVQPTAASRPTATRSPAPTTTPEPQVDNAHLRKALGAGTYAPGTNFSIEYAFDNTGSTTWSD